MICKYVFNVECNFMIITTRKKNVITYFFINIYIKNLIQDFNWMIKRTPKMSDNKWKSYNTKKMWTPSRKSFGIIFYMFWKLKNDSINIISYYLLRNSTHYIEKSSKAKTSHVISNCSSNRFAWYSKLINGLKR